MTPGSKFEEGRRPPFGGLLVLVRLRRARLRNFGLVRRSVSSALTGVVVYRPFLRTGAGLKPTVVDGAITDAYRLATEPDRELVVNSEVAFVKENARFAFHVR